MKVSFLTLAQREVDDAVAWYNNQATGLKAGEKGLGVFYRRLSGKNETGLVFGREKSGVFYTRLSGKKMGHAGFCRFCAEKEKFRRRNSGFGLNT